MPSIAPVHRSVSLGTLRLVPPENPYRNAPILSEDEDAERARRAIERDLDPGETILWAGLPKQGLYLAPTDVAMIPFSLAWGGFAFFWEWGVIHSNAPLLFRLWGVPFCCVGLYMIVGRFIYDAYLRARTFYAVTNRRILIVTWARTRDLISLDISNQPMTLSESRDGSGMITFATSLNMFGSARGKTSPPAFKGITNARAVLATINEAKETLRLSRKNDVGA
jgi:hypothetical protein